MQKYGYSITGYGKFEKIVCYIAHSIVFTLGLFSCIINGVIKTFIYEVLMIF